MPVKDADGPFLTRTMHNPRILYGFPQVFKALGEKRWGFETRSPALLAESRARVFKPGRAQGLGLGGFVLEKSLHGKAHAALFVGFDDLDADLLAFLEVV